jgi:hypothetical protein
MQASALFGTAAPRWPGDPFVDSERLIVDSTLLSVLDPGRVKESCASEGEAWVRIIRCPQVKLLILCSTNRVPLAYELTAANAADVPLMLKVMYASVLVEPRASDDRCVEIGPVKRFVRTG